MCLFLANVKMSLLSIVMDHDLTVVGGGSQKGKIQGVLADLMGVMLNMIPSRVDGMRCGVCCDLDR